MFNIQHLCYDAVGCYLKQQTQFYGGKQSKAEVCRLEPTNNFRLGKHHHQTHTKWMDAGCKGRNQGKVNHEIGRQSLQICTWVQRLFAWEFVSSCPHWHKLD